MKIKENSKKLIQVNDLSVDFYRNGKYNRVLNNVSLEIKEGEIVGLVGESGSGKTTLGRAMLSLIDHATGNVLYEGKEIPKKHIKYVHKKNEWVYRTGQMIFQNPTTSLDAKKKVLDIVGEGLKNFKVIEKEIDHKIEKHNEKINEFKIQLKKLINPRRLLIREEEKRYKDEIENFIKHLVEIDPNLKQIDSFREEYKNVDKQLENIKKSFLFFKNKLSSEISNFKHIKKTKINNFNHITKTENKYFEKAINTEAEEMHLASNYEKPNNYYLTHLLEKNIKWFASLSNSLKTKYKINRKSKINFSNINTYEAYKKETISLIEIIKNEIITEKKEENKIDFYSIIFQLEERLNWRSARNTKIFNYISNYVVNEVKNNIKKLEDVVISLEQIIKSKKNEITYLAFEKEREIFNEEIASLLYEQVLSRDQIKFYEGFLNDVEFLIENHKFENRKSFYQFLILKNKQICSLHIALTNYKYRKKIERNQKLLNFKRNDFVNSMKELKNLRIDFYEEIKIHDKKWILNYAKNKDPIKYERIITQHAKNINIINEKYKFYEYARHKEKELKDSILNEVKNIRDLKKSIKGKNYKKIFTETIHQILSLVGLHPESANNFPTFFSGGQQQRIGIARALVNKPKFIIADEPISALDVSVQAQVVNLLKKLNKELGLTIIFIAHDLEMVKYLTDRVYVMYKGDIVEHGNTNSVYSKPIHPYTRSLMGSIPKLENHGKNLTLSNYDAKKHMYNEYTNIKNIMVGKDHFVRGTEKEIKSWKYKK